MFKTKRLSIIKANLVYISQYYEDFTEEICKYQYPDSFKSIDEAEELITYFLDEMDNGNMLECMILDNHGEFLGSMEAFGLKEDIIEVGLWLKKSAQRNGYGYEALKGLLDYLAENYTQDSYVYEVDERNTPSIALIEKFPHVVKEVNEVVTESGKKLRLIPCIINKRCISD